MGEAPNLTNPFRYSEEQHGPPFQNKTKQNIPVKS